MPRTQFSLVFVTAVSLPTLLQCSIYFSVFYKKKSFFRYDLLVRRKSILFYYYIFEFLNYINLQSGYFFPICCIKVGNYSLHVYLRPCLCLNKKNRETIITNMKKKCSNKMKIYVHLVAPFKCLAENFLIYL